MVKQELENLKKQYNKLKKKYDLPSFEDVNKDFEIEKLQDRERSYLLRDIRRTMIERNLSYFKFLEMFLNPSSGPMFFMALSNHLTDEEKDKIEELYFKMGKFELDSVKLDNDDGEEKEAEFIKSFYQEWQNMKNEFGSLMDSLEKIWEREVERDEKG